MYDVELMYHVNFDSPVEVDQDVNVKLVAEIILQCPILRSLAANSCFCTVQLVP